MHGSTTSVVINPSSPSHHPADAPFEWTFWPGRFATSGVPRSCSWGVLCDKLSVCDVALVKDRMAGWSPARFVEHRRGLANVASVSAVVLDYDAKRVETKFEDAQRHFSTRAALMISTHSHGEVHRFRVVLPTSRHVSAKEYDVLWQHMFDEVARAGHEPGMVEKDASRFWYLPGHPLGQAGFQHAVCQGPALDVDGILEHENAVRAERESVARTERARVAAERARQKASQAKSERSLTVLERASLLLEDIEGGVSGSGGSAHCFDAAQVLVRGFNLSDAQALSLLETEYNPRCSPPWSRRELMHKIKSARERSNKPFGFLLGDRETWVTERRACRHYESVLPPLWSPEEEACTYCEDVPSVPAERQGGSGG